MRATSISPRRVPLLAALVLALSCAACSEQRVVTIADNEFHFHGAPRRVRGIPVKRIRRDWCKVIELTKEMFPPEMYSADDFDSMTAQGIAFAVDAPLDGTGIEQTAVLGLYETCSGEKGSFLLILDRSSVFTGKIRFLSTILADRAFNAMWVQPDGTLTITHCLACDYVSNLKWDKAAGTFVWQPEEEEGTSSQ